MPMQRNLTTTKNEDYWRFVKQVADEVQRWPDWKRAQRVAVVGDIEQKTERMFQVSPKSKQE